MANVLESGIPLPYDILLIIKEYLEKDIRKRIEEFEDIFEDCFESHVQQYIVTMITKMHIRKRAQFRNRLFLEKFMWTYSLSWVHEEKELMHQKMFEVGGVFYTRYLHPGEGFDYLGISFMQPTFFM